MKKVLFISPQPFFQWRGSPIRVNFNILALTGLGYRVDLLTLPIGEDKSFENGRVIRVANPFSMKNIAIGPSLPKIFFDILLFGKGLQLCIKNNYDVIHGVEEAGLIAVVLARLFGTKAIFEKHSDPFSYKKGVLKNSLLSVYSLVEKVTVRLCDGVIGTGKGLVAQVRAMGYSTRVFHIFDIPSSLQKPDGKQVKKFREKLAQNPDEILVTFVGSFALYQGVELMFAAIPKIVKKNARVRFVIIGGSETEIDARKLEFKKLQIEDRVSFLGKVAPDILPAYLAASDILLSPRISGVNTPLKILDYMKAGKPIMATDVPSHRLLLDETTAVMAQPDPDHLAEALDILAGDEEKRLKMGAAGRNLYEKKYNFTNYQLQLSRCYQEVLAR